MRRTILILTALAMLAFAPTASAAGTGCLVDRGIKAKVDAYNVMNLTLRGFIRGKESRVLRGTAQTFRDGVLVYSDPLNAVGRGSFAVEVMEQLPLSWRGVKLRTVVTLRNGCGSIVRSVTYTTPRNPRP